MSDYTYNPDLDITEDKEAWCRLGNKFEREFAFNILPKFGIVAEINNDTDKYAPDFTINGILADLKYSANPFIKARSYGIKDPRTEHSFNRKDYLRYKELYPHVLIFFWHRFERKSYTIGEITTQIEPMNHVWYIKFEYLSILIEANAFPLHQYARRINDTDGNAKDSYVLDLSLKNFNDVGEVC